MCETFKIEDQWAATHLGRHLSLSLSLSTYTYICLYMSIHIFIFLSINKWVYKISLPTNHSTHKSLSLYVGMQIPIYIYICACVCVYQHASQLVSLSKDRIMQIEKGRTDQSWRRCHHRVRCFQAAGGDFQRRPWRCCSPSVQPPHIHLNRESTDKTMLHRQLTLLSGLLSPENEHRMTVNHFLAKCL